MPVLQSLISLGSRQDHTVGLFLPAYT